MGFLLFVAAMTALCLMSTTKESRGAARAEARRKGIDKWWKWAGITSWAIIFSFFVF